MKLVIYSNCQGQGLRWFLKHSDCHMLNITSCHLLYNYKILKFKEKIPIQILKNADVFIYQPIHKRHGIYSTDLDIENNILSHLPTHCKQISFPYIYNSALWPVIRPCEIDGFTGEFSNMNEYLNQKPIHQLIDEGCSIDMVLQLYEEQKINFNFEERHTECMTLLRHKELTCDVKIADYIDSNIHSRKLFLTQNHPTTCMFVHCTNQILHMLDCKVQFDYNRYPENVIKLAGLCKHSMYDIKFWNFTYEVADNKDEYKNDIRNICNNYRV
jgi:hypothetical protein